MKICIFSPYIPKHFGGGEKYIFQIAIALAKKHTVSIAIANNEPLSPEKIQKTRHDYQKFLNCDLSQISFISTPLSTTDSSFLKKLFWTRQFDLIYYLTDGSLFFSLAKKNILHIQFPFKNLKLSLIDRIKLLSWKVTNANSKFTKDVVEKFWGIKIDYIHYPAAIPNNFFYSNTKKEKIILNVGRFFKHLNSKRQDILIDIFKQLRLKDKRTMTDWQLVFVGGVEDESYLAELKEKAKGLPVVFYTSAAREILENLYQKSSIYWHAAGYGVDELTYPEKVEHFGISTIEAMAAGCVPVVHNKGGQAEIMTGDLKTLSWNTPQECETITLNLLNNQLELESRRLEAIQRARDFSSQIFEKTLFEMVDG